MKLSPIGIGSGFSDPAVLKNNSWYMIINDTMYVFDCPYTNIDWFVKNKAIVKKLKKIMVFITHMHEDHIGGLSNLSWLLNSYGKKLWLYFPTKSFVYLANYLELTNSCLPNIQLTQGDYYQDEEVQIFPREVNHIDGVICYAYVVYGDTGFISETGNNWNIYYSGDTKNFADSDIINSFIAQPVGKHIYHEITFDPSTEVHCYKDKITSRITKPLRSQVSPMHIDKYGDIKRLKALGFNTDDLMQFIPEK